MKNKSVRHKGSNTFKFVPFSERIANIDIDIFHKVGHQYEALTKENESYFYQAIGKWNVLNLTEGFEAFCKEIRANNYITLPQVLLSKDQLIEVLIKYLKLKDPLYLQPLLEIVVAVAKDLQKEFYQYYPQLLEILIELLNTKHAEQLEWTFTCLAYLFKFLWRPLVKDINNVFKALLPLLSDNKPEYINNFAAESFAFVARKVRDKKAFLTLLLKAVSYNEDAIEGCGKLLFHVINGIDGQFHSSAEIMLPVLLQSLFDEKLPQNVLFEVLEEVIYNIVFTIKPYYSTLLWSVFRKILEELTEKFKTKKEEKTVTDIELIIKLIGQSIEYTGGRFLQHPESLIKNLINLLNCTELSESVYSMVTQVGVLLLLSRQVGLTQEHASNLIKNILSLPHKSVLLCFVDNISKYSSFEALILPSFLRYCVKNNLDDDCFHTLTKLILKKAPLSKSGSNLEEWKKYKIDFKENNLQMINILMRYITPSNDLFTRGIDNYYCSLICLPHLIIKETKAVLLETLKTNVESLIKRIGDNISEEELLKKLLFLLNGTIECLIHLSGGDIIVTVFDKVVNCLFDLEQYPKCILYLETLSLCITALKNNSNIITMELLKKINVVLESKFSSPFHEVRLIVSHIYSSFDNLPEFVLQYSKKPGVKSKKWKVFSICYNVESTEPQIRSYREQLHKLEKLSFMKPRMLMCNQTDFKMIPLRYLCGTLYMNFQLLWEPVSEIITSHAKGLEINTFWNIFGQELQRVVDNIRNPNEVVILTLEESKCDFLKDMFEESQKLKVKPDFVNYRLLLWKAMSTFTEIAEAKTRDVSELLLDFVRNEYINVNSDMASVYSIKENSTKEEVNNEDATASGEHDDEINSSGTTKTKGKPTIRTLECKLNVFSQMRSPMSMYQEPDLYKLYFDLLQHKYPDIQKVALDCIMTYKRKDLMPYKQNLYNLVDDKNFKNEITTFRIDKESNMIVQDHRPTLLPIVMQIVFGKMSAKTGLRTGGKSSSQFRRNLVFRFLAGCEEPEMLSFVQKAFRFYSKFLHSDPEVLVDSIMEDLDLEKFIPPKRIHSAINLLNVILDQFGGLMGDELLSYLLNIVLVIGALIKGALDQYEHVHAGFLPILRNTRTASIKIVSRFFEQFDRYSWSNKQINAIFTVFIWPYLSKLNVEGIHSPTTLLKLIVQWGSNPRYFPLLVKHEKGNQEQYVLPHVMKLLLNEKSHITVINAIEEMLEKLLSLQPDEEDLQMALPVDNLLPIPEDILSKMGLINQLNYGSCILLPHVPHILNKMKKKLMSKSKNLNQRELFILSRISELVWEADISDTILQLLLPLFLKKCNSSTGEEVILKFLTTVLNLIRNVEKPQIHLKEISPLFAEISFPCCRKMLTEILEVIAEKSKNENLKLASNLIVELNAWDSKWVDQPDFDRRGNAFTEVETLIKDNKIEVHLGVLLIHNCYYLLKTGKEISLRDNSVYTLKLLCPVLIGKYQSNHKEIDYILNDTLFTLIRNGIKLSNNDVRNDCISLLGHLARECPESHFILRDLHKYTNKSDLEVDFFENLTHLQIHRHARALLKFCQITKEQTTLPNPRTLMQFILPLASFFLCSEKYASKNSILDAAIETIGVVCRVLPWHQYEGLLKFYLARLRHKVEYQKQLVRLTVAILDAFHFDLSKGHPSEEVVDTDKERTENEVPEQQDNKIGKVDGDNGGENNDMNESEDVDKGDEELQIDDALENDDDEEEEEPSEASSATKICDKITILCKSTATRVIRTIQMVLLPQLHKSLAELTHYDSSHKVNRKMTGFEREEEDLLRVPISLALVKLLHRLPVQLLESNLPGVFVKLCTFLKSRLDSVRKAARETLQKIMLTLGPKYLNLLLAAMMPLLSKGFEVHVLVYTIHGVLHCLKDIYQPTDIDKILLSVLKLCTADLFGILSDEKEVKKINAKVFEAKSTKSYDTLQILAQYITQSCLLDLIVPIKQILESTHSSKTVQKAEEALKHIALGLVDNTFISTESLLAIASGTASESIPQLLTPKKEPLSEKHIEQLKRERPDCFLIQKVPNNRNAYREQNVKISAQTNAHLLIEFGLKLCLVMLKREKVKVESYEKYVDPFVMIFKECLNSKHVKISTLTLQCLTWTMKYELPTQKKNIELFVKEIFSILHKYASSKLDKGDNLDLLMAAFKAMAVLVRDVKYYAINTNQLKVLLLYVDHDLDNHAAPAIAFNLLKAIIARKFIPAEMEPIMKKVAVLSIKSESSHVREQCRAVYYQFMMGSPLDENTLEYHLGFYVPQLKYALQHGRESAIDMIVMIINSYPMEVLKSFSGLLLREIGDRMHEDNVPECRIKAYDTLCLMLQRLSKNARDDLFKVVILYMQCKNIICRMKAANMCRAFVTVEKTEFESRLPELEPVLLKELGLNNSPGKYVKLNKTKEHKCTDEDDYTCKANHLIAMLHLLISIYTDCPSFLKEKDTTEILATHMQTLLAHSNECVIRCLAARVLGFVLSSIDIERLSQLYISNESDSGYLYNDPSNSITALTLDSVGQLQFPDIESILAQESVKILVFIARVLQKVPLKDSYSDGKIDLLVLTRQMRHMVNNEVVTCPSSTNIRTHVFKWIAAITEALEVDAINSVLYHLLGPLVREMVTTEEKNAPLRQLSKSTASLIKSKVGENVYRNMLSKLEQTMSVKRAERKRVSTQLAVTDPELFAKKKIKRNEKKKESKKRKIEEMKGVKRTFNKRKVIELDSSEIP